MRRLQIQLSDDDMAKLEQLRLRYGTTDRTDTIRRIIKELAQKPPEPETSQSVSTALEIIRKQSDVIVTLVSILPKP